MDGHSPLVNTDFLSLNGSLGPLCLSLSVIRVEILGIGDAVDTAFFAHVAAVVVQQGNCRVLQQICCEFLGKPLPFKTDLFR